jgi:hypothetical protein
MNYLYEKLDVLREEGFAKPIPQYISRNLGKKFKLRPYQIGAFMVKNTN